MTIRRRLPLLALVAFLLTVTTWPRPASAVPIRLDYTITDIGGGLFDYEFFLIVDNNDGSFLPGQGWRWLIFGDQQEAPSPLTAFVGDPGDLPIGPWTFYTSSSGFHNGPTLGDVLDYWKPTDVGDSLFWSGTSTAFLGQGELLWSTLAGTQGGGVPADFTVANLVQPCFEILKEQIICHADGSTFTYTAQGVNACTGAMMTVSFTGSGGEVGEDFCFTVTFNDEQGFCCSTQVCFPVPDCSEAAQAGDLDGDGVVGIQDLLILLAEWGPCPPKGACPADFDIDGEVGITDLLLLLANWG